MKDQNYNDWYYFKLYDDKNPQIQVANAVLAGYIRRKRVSEQLNISHEIYITKKSFSRG